MASCRFGNGLENEIATPPTGKYETMVLTENFMYAVNNTDLITFDIRDRENPKEINRQEIGSEIENLFESSGTLFIGSSSRMHIYSIEKSGIPAEKSETTYSNVGLSEDVQVCDPVIAKDNRAYVTLTNVAIDVPCGTANVNELRMYDVQDLSTPSLMQRLDLISPMGISISDNYLFVANMNDVQVFDISSPAEMKFVTKYPTEGCYDVIAKNNKLFFVSKKHIKQYGFNDVRDIVLETTMTL